MRHHSKRVRDQAAMICSVMACTPIYSFCDAVLALGLAEYCAARCLASDAFTVVRADDSCTYDVMDPINDAEAEALIRSGEL